MNRRGRGHTSGYGQGGNPGAGAGGKWKDPAAVGAFAVFNSFTDRKGNNNRIAGGGANAEAAAKKVEQEFAPQFSSEAGGVKPAETISAEVEICGRPSTAVSLDDFLKRAIQDEFNSVLGFDEADGPKIPLFAFRAEREVLRAGTMKKLLSYYEGQLRAGEWPPEKTKGQREGFIRWVFERKALEQQAEKKKAHETGGGEDPEHKFSDPVVPGFPVELSESMYRETLSDAGHMESVALQEEKSRALVLGTAQKSVDLLQELHVLALPNSLERCKVAVQMNGPLVLPPFTVVWDETRGIATFSKQQQPGAASGSASVCQHEFLVGHARRMQFLFRHFCGPILDEIYETLSKASGNSGSGPQDEEKKKVWMDRQFATAVFAMLERYRAISGVKPNDGSGHHAAIPPQLHHCLSKHLAVEMELFASPFNSHHPRYCSLFRDSDCVFGSCGSFFQFYPLEGSFEANPPFVEEVMMEMVDHMECLLWAAENGDSPHQQTQEGNKLKVEAERGGGSRALSFVIVIPHWTNPVPPATLRLEGRAAGGEEKKTHNFLQKRVVVPADEHAYLDGFQHCLRDAPFKPVHDTLLLVLQTTAGAAKWPVTEEAVTDLLATWKATTENIVRPTIFQTAPTAEAAGTQDSSSVPSERQKRERGDE